MSDELPKVDELDILSLGGSKAKGKRPYFLKDPDVERVLSITMAVAGELAVLRARMDTIEELLADKGTISKADIDNFAPTAAQSEARGQWNQEYLARILRIIQQEREALAQPDDATAEEVGEQLAQD